MCVLLPVMCVQRARVLLLLLLLLHRPLPPQPMPPPLCRVWTPLATRQGSARTGPGEEAMRASLLQPAGTSSIQRRRQHQRRDISIQRRQQAAASAAGDCECPPQTLYVCWESQQSKRSQTTGIVIS